MLLSVIIPIYDVENYIRECFESILVQKFDDIEFICIDDGSTDTSGSICDEYAQKDNRLIVKHSENRGVAAARNLGLSLAKGKYIAWIDPDDYISSNWIEMITKAICENDWDILVFDYTILKDDKRVVREYKNKTGFIDKFEFLSDIVDDQIIQSQLWQKVFKRELFEGIVFPETAKCMEDYAVMHKIIEKASNIFYLNEILYFYRVRNDGLVMEVDLEKSYNCYLIAKERYKYLKVKYKNISRIGFLCQALGFCIQFDKIKNENKNVVFKERYKLLSEEIAKNINYLLSMKINILLKVKFVFLYLGILKIALDWYGFIRRLKNAEI